MIEVTARQAEIFAFLESFIEEHGYPPTRQEIATHFGLASPNGVEQHLRALEKRGAIKITSGVARGIRVLAKSEKA